MIYSSISYQFQIHPKPFTDAEKAIFTQKYYKLMTCLQLVDTCYSINLLLWHWKKIEILVHMKEMIYYYSYTIIWGWFTSAILFLFSGSIITTLCKDPSTSEVIKLSSMSPSSYLSMLSKYWVKNLGVKVEVGIQVHGYQTCTLMLHRHVEEVSTHKRMVCRIHYYQKQIYNSGQCNLVQMVNVSDQHQVCLSTSSKQPWVIKYIWCLRQYPINLQKFTESENESLCNSEDLSPINRSIRLSHIDVQRQNGVSDSGLFRGCRRLEFMRWSFTKHNNFSEGLMNLRKTPEYFECRGWLPHEILARITCCNSLCQDLVHGWRSPQSQIQPSSLTCTLWQMLPKEYDWSFPCEKRRSRKHCVIYEQDVLVHCICRLPWNRFNEIRGPMVYCARYNEWYHQLCVGIQSSILYDPSAQYTCHACSS